LDLLSTKIYKVVTLGYRSWIYMLYRVGKEIRKSALETKPRLGELKRANSRKYVPSMQSYL